MSEKRILEGSHESGAVPPLPPFKKRLTPGTIQPFHSSIAEVNVQDMPELVEESLSKQDLLKGMRFAKMEYLATKERWINTIQADAMTGLVRLQLDLLRNEFVSAAAVTAATSCLKITMTGNEDATLVTQEIRAIGIMVTNEVKAWFKQADEIKKANNPELFVQFLKTESRHVSEANKMLERYMYQLEHEEQIKRGDTDVIAKQVLILTHQLEERLEQFEVCLERLRTLEKKEDRAQSQMVSVIMKDKREDRVTPFTPERPDVGGIMKEEYEFLTHIRSKEILYVSQERVQLADIADGYMMQMRMMRDEQIMKSSYVHHLMSSIDFHRGRSYYYEHRRLHLEKEYDKIKKERRFLKTQIQSERDYQENILATEEKNLKSNLARITAQRDHLLQLCQSQSEKETQSKEKEALITNEGEKQKQRMLELQQIILSKRNDDGSLAIKESQRVKELLCQIDLTHGIMHVLGQNGNEPSNHSKETIHHLKSNLTRLSGTRGDALELLDKLVKQRMELTLIVDFYENTDRLLFAQMDCDGSVFERRIKHMEFTMSKKREHIYKIEAEKQKFSQTFPGLENEKAKILNKINASKRIVHQQADRIKVKEQREKELVAHVSEQEAVLMKLIDDLENYHLQIDDYSQECVELGRRLEIYETQLLEMKRISFEKTRALDEEVSLQKQVEEEYKQVQRKWAMITLGENPASQQLIDEVEDLRAQFKCSTCKTRTRKCILLSCYHTFCNECIKTRLETRQRRCPSCALNFGASDVKEFYLYNTIN
ncbi:uncharacterized protein EV154DRAFT_503364 [Mucor mucedo]|uniref:uncharacterized protein n=1 Tax=Mucor mucedo TaxID=29922 RepID=UPI002220CD1A|nr:uncharacterized protein EV154DRAFT_503364 [Mucor mucedo]KAI7892922.1 hypothetical protein EV154DRAFT_503364 [Mucor mucedo]